MSSPFSFRFHVPRPKERRPPRLPPHNHRTTQKSTRSTATEELPAHKVQRVRCKLNKRVAVDSGRKKPLTTGQSEVVVDQTKSRKPKSRFDERASEAASSTERKRPTHLYSSIDTTGRVSTTGSKVDAECGHTSLDSGTPPSSILNPRAPSFVPSTNELPQKEKAKASSKMRLRGGLARSTSSACRMQTSKDNHKKTEELFNQGDGNMMKTTQNSIDNCKYHCHRHFGPKVTIIDREMKIFVVDLITPEECNWIMFNTALHTNHARALNQDTWRKLYTYTKHDLPCSEVLALQPFITKILRRIRRLVGRLLAAPWAASHLTPRTWKEPHLLQYRKGTESGEDGCTGMTMHYDGGNLTWQLMLGQFGVDYSGTYCSLMISN